MADEIETTEADDPYTYIHVRVRDPRSQFVKDRLDYPDKDDKEHEDDPPKRFNYRIQGYDEYGDPVCPVYRVPMCAEITDALSNDKVIDPKTKKVVTSGRLTEVRGSLLNNFPHFVGAPTIDDSAEEIWGKVEKINSYRERGDAILNKKRQPFEDFFFNPRRSDNDRILYSRFLEAMEQHDPERYKILVAKLSRNKEAVAA